MPRLLRNRLPIARHLPRLPAAPPRPQVARVPPAATSCMNTMQPPVGSSSNEVLGVGTTPSVLPGAQLNERLILPFCYKNLWVKKNVYTDRRVFQHNHNFKQTVLLVRSCSSKIADLK